MNLAHKLNHPVFKAISAEAKKLNEDAYVIGGFVRDLLLERDDKDIDIVCIGSGIELAQNVAKSLKIKKVSLFKTFKTAMFKYGDFEIEFVGARKESYRYDSRKPVVEDGTLEDDQNRRDFSINAMAISLNEHNYGALLDPFGGMKDLSNKLLRTPLDPDITFSDDPLRMMRGIRFATELGFKIDPPALKAINAIVSGSTLYRWKEL
jgi:poly(A) polymerase